MKKHLDQGVVVLWVLQILHAVSTLISSVYIYIVDPSNERWTLISKQALVVVFLL